MKLIKKYVKQKKKRTGQGLNRTKQDVKERKGYGIVENQRVWIRNAGQGLDKSIEYVKAQFHEQGLKITNYRKFVYYISVPLSPCTKNCFNYSFEFQVSVVTYVSVVMC